MKFEESFLSKFLIQNLEPLTEADPVILAEYVATLLKKDKPTKELQKLCTDNLVEFLGHDTQSFITKLFQALEDGSFLASSERSDSFKQVEPSSSRTAVDPVVQEGASPKLEKFSSSSGPVSDPEEKEVSDDDDDDRNHKHRRRETHSLSSEKDAQEQFFRGPNRKRDKPFENGQPFLRNDPQSSNFSPLEGAKLEKRRAGLASFPTRVIQTLRNDCAPRFDMSTSLNRPPIGRGRGRSNGPWNQHDTRFSSIDTLDFASQIAPQGPIPTSLFAGRGIPDAAAAQSASWGTFGLIHGMPNGGLETLHPLGLQGTLRPTISPSLNMGIPRQRCRDFEERGFCLRGDMCPMEHGLHRIVVEDVQSLSQFNLPVSIPSTRLLGMQVGSGSLPPVTASSTVMTSTKGLHGKIHKTGVTDDGLSLSGAMASTTDAGGADLYDPDQPLWNNDHPETSGALLRLPSPKLEDTEPLWNADPSDRHSLRSVDGNDSKRPGRGLSVAVGLQSAASSVWGRIGSSGNRTEMIGKIDSTINATSYLGHEMKEDQEETVGNTRGTAQQSKHAFTEDVVPKAKNFSSTQKQRMDSGRNVGRSSQKAQCTLFVNGIPLKNNKREALLSHFQKFGEVIDIHIPSNSERAFVQFSKREEAEAALRAPDAVMGNRFIKLWWANRDSILVDGEGSGNIAPSVNSRGTIIASVSPHPSAESGKENRQSMVPKLSTTPVTDGTSPAAAAPRSVVANSPKATPPLQKKLELELLKEELRKKQEMLDQKRNDFRRQLDKLEKQAVTVKGEMAVEQAVKRPKVETVTDVIKSSTPSHMNPVVAGTQPEAEKASEQSNFGENIGISSSPKPNSSSMQHMQQSPGSLKQPSRLPPSVGSPFLVNRFKLDNRPTAFTVVPPLPADFANVSLLKEHFSSFGDLSKVELNDQEGHGGSPHSKPFKNVSACITFTTRRSAERAFQNGKCWQGHKLQFTWLTTSNHSSSNNSSGGISPSTKMPLDAEIPAEESPSSGKSTCTVVSQAAAVSGNKEPVNDDGMVGHAECMVKALVEDSHSSSPTKLSCEKQSPELDVPNVGDDLNVGLTE